MSTPAPKKKSKHAGIKTIDDYIKGEHDIEKAFAEYDKHMDEDLQNHLFNNIFAPAQDHMYDAMVKSLDEDFDNDESSTHGKKKELQKAAVAGLKAFFKKSSPSVLKSLEDSIKKGYIKEDDIEAQYEMLQHYYDNVELKHGGEGDMKKGIYSLKILIDSAHKNKKMNLGKLKKQLYTQKAPHAERIQGNYTTSMATHALSRVKQHKLADYIRDKAEKKGIKVTEASKFYTLNQHHDLIDIRNGLEKGDWSKPLDQYFLEYEKKEKKEEKKKK